MFLVIRQILLLLSISNAYIILSTVQGLRCVTEPHVARSC